MKLSCKIFFLQIKLHWGSLWNELIFFFKYFWGVLYTLLLTMERERPHPCNICGKKFHQMNQLRQHKIIHKPEEERPFSCYVCGKKFNRLHHLKLHVMVHMGQSPHTCEICGRTCNQQSDLKKHQMIHTGERPHSCPICGKGFIQIGGMKRHIEKHNEDKISLTCEFCGKEFTKPSYLKKHVQSHTNERPFICKVCSKSFSRESALKQHIVVHNAEEPYVCEKCGKTFKRAGNLEKHFAMHSGGLPYQCTVCGKDFLQLGSYKKHMAFHGIILSSPEEVPQCDSILSDCDVKPTICESPSGGKIIVKIADNVNVPAPVKAVTNASNLVGIAHGMPSINYAVDNESKNKNINIEVPENDSVKVSSRESLQVPALRVIDRGSLEAQESETRDSIGSQIDDSLVHELANNVLCVLDECSLDDVSFNDEDEGGYMVVVEKPIEEDLQELVNSVS